MPGTGIGPGGSGIAGRSATPATPAPAKHCARAHSGRPAWSPALRHAPPLMQQWPLPAPPWRLLLLLGLLAALGGGRGVDGLLGGYVGEAELVPYRH